VIDKDGRQPRFENRTVQMGMSPPSTAPSPKKPEWKSAGFYVVAGTELRLNIQAAVVDRLLPLESISN
jgi:hypothetical protein